MHHGGVRNLHKRSRTYFGGMSPIVPILVVAAVIALLAIGERLGSSFLLALVLAGAALLAYVVRVLVSRSKTVLHSQVIPFTAGLAAAVAIGASGLGLGGFGDPWGTNSLLLAILVATGVMAGVRALLPSTRTETLTS